MNPTPSPCPCGRDRPLAACCGALLAGAPAAGAEDLMRSRYTAFVLDRRDHLLATWHPDTRPAALPPPEPGLRWLGLEVRRHVVVDDSHATVEFVARSKLGGRAFRLHENSRFVREGGRWYYVDGDLK
jgi:SEC-C motif-containing protein